MCDMVVDHLQMVPIWLVVHITDAGVVSGAVFDRTSSRVPTTARDH